MFSLRCVQALASPMLSPLGLFTAALGFGHRTDRQEGLLLSRGPEPQHPWRLPDLHGPPWAKEMPGHTWPLHGPGLQGGTGDRGSDLAHLSCASILQQFNPAGGKKRFEGKGKKKHLVSHGTTLVSLGVVGNCVLFG